MSTQSQISDATAFDNDMRFNDGAAVRDYFTLDTIRGMGIDADDLGADDDDRQYALVRMAADVIANGWHMIGEVQRIATTTVIVHTGNYGACEITGVSIDVEDRLEDEEREDVDEGERYRVVTTYSVETHQAGGGITNTNWETDPEPMFLASAPTGEQIARWAREATDDLYEAREYTRRDRLTDVPA